MELNHFEWYNVLGAALCLTCIVSSGNVPDRFTLLTGIPGLILLFA